MYRPQVLLHLGAFPRPDTIVRTTSHDLEWCIRFFLYFKTCIGIVHIINHTVHILWEEVMIFTDKRGMVLDFGFPRQEVNNLTLG